MNNIWSVIIILQFIQFFDYVEYPPVTWQKLHFTTRFPWRYTEWFPWFIENNFSHTKIILWNTVYFIRACLPSTFCSWQLYVSRLNIFVTFHRIHKEKKPDKFRMNWSDLFQRVTNERKYWIWIASLFEAFLWKSLNVFETVQLLN